MSSKETNQLRATPAGQAGQWESSISVIAPNRLSRNILECRAAAQRAIASFEKILAQANANRGLVKMRSWDIMLLSSVTEKASAATIDAIRDGLHEKKGLDDIARPLINRGNLAGVKYLIEYCSDRGIDSSNSPERRIIDSLLLPILTPEQKAVMLEVQEIDTNFALSIESNHKQAVEYFQKALLPSFMEGMVPTLQHFVDWAALDENGLNPTYPTSSSLLNLSNGMTQFAVPASAGVRRGTF